MHTNTKFRRSLASLRARREAAPRSPSRQLGMTLLEIMIVLAILALVMGLVVGPKLMAMFSDSKVQIAQAKVQKLANESFGYWKTTKGRNKACPDSIADMTDEAAEKNLDPWGKPYQMLCGSNVPKGAGAFAVYSFGEDNNDDRGAESTDDVVSWR